jgi:hypothetical protein
MINVPRLYSQRTGEAGGAGLDAEIFARLQLDGEIFFLTSSFIERSGGKIIIRVPEARKAPQ